jgi:hypothetical protein
MNDEHVMIMRVEQCLQEFEDRGPIHERNNRLMTDLYLFQYIKKKSEVKKQKAVVSPGVHEDASLLDITSNKKS